jgi:hypothetical protein
MFVKILKEAGYEEALFGLSLSFYDHKIPASDFRIFESLCKTRCNVDRATNRIFWNTDKFAKAEKIAKLLANKEVNPLKDFIRNNPDYIRAEQKFLRSIVVWIYIQAPRGWWSEYDTYTVGMTKQSSSTMHTLDKRPVTSEDFEEGTEVLAITAFNRSLQEYRNKESPYYKDVTRLKMNLPEGWLQERQICTNYDTLRNILNQREGHRLKFWNVHNTEILSQLDHPELIRG